MSKRKPKVAETTLSDWDKLRGLIAEYAEAYVADSWKGGGDPEDYEVIELELKLSQAKLSTHIEKMERKLS